ncbi:MAG: tetratricopeptide repeat protein [Caulobacteraceae bacterium]
MLAPLAAAQPNAAGAQLEHGLVLAGLGRTPEAIAALTRATRLKPDLPLAWRALADQFVLTGDYAAADAAYARQIKASVNDPALVEAAAALCEDRLAVAERLLRAFLKAHPTDVAAIRMLGEVGTRLGRYEDAEALLSRCLELAPGFTAARHNYAVVLYRQSKAAEALAEVGRLLAAEPGNPAFRALRAATLARLGDYEPAIGEYEALLKDYPAQPKAWLSYGHALKTVGRREDGVGAYRPRHRPAAGGSARPTGASPT